MYQAICTNPPTVNNFGYLQCPSGWQMVQYVESTSLQQFVDLLSFDLQAFNLLMGVCVLFFIMGHTTGHVARTMGRV